MKRSTLLTALLFAVSCLLCAAQARANSTTYGSSIISYDPNTDTITATGTTEPDYYAEDYYEARVVCSLSDSNGNYLGSGAATDTWDAGYASVTLEYTGTTPGTQYTLRSLHGFIMGVEDPSYECECYFDDYYDYGFYGNQGIDEADCFYFLGTGPLVVRHTSGMTLGYTNASTTVAPPTVSSLQASVPYTNNTSTVGTFTTTNNSTAFATTSTTDLAVVFQGSNTVVTVSAQGVSPASAANQLKWTIVRDSSDTVATGLPSLSASTGAQITGTPSVAGNFNLICYYDTNKNGGYDPGEELKVLHLAVVRFTVQSNDALITKIGANFVGSQSGSTAYGVQSSEDIMTLECAVLLEGGGANRLIGVSQVTIGSIQNLTVTSFTINYPVPTPTPAPPGNVAGTGVENPGDQLPVLDSGVDPTGGTSVFNPDDHGGDYNNSFNTSPPTGGQLRTLNTSDNPGFGPWSINHPNTHNPWMTTQGGYDFSDYISAVSSTFHNYYAVLAKGLWTVRVVGSNNGGTWTDNGSSVNFPGGSSEGANLSNMLNNGSPTTGDNAGMRVSGKSYTLHHSITYSP